MKLESPTSMYQLCSCGGDGEFTYAQPYKNERSPFTNLVKPKQMLLLIYFQQKLEVVVSNRRTASNVISECSFSSSCCLWCFMI